MSEEKRLYVGKLCLNSHVNRVEDNRGYKEYQKGLNVYLHELYYLINNNRDHIYTNEYKYTNKETNKLDIKYIDYRLFIREIKEDYIYADLRRDNVRFYQDENRIGEIISKPVENVESISFYLDFKSEYIIYDTTTNFGHKEFRDFFGRYINSLMKESDKFLKLEFEIIAIKNKESVKGFYKEIIRVKNIKKITIDYIPINANRKLFDQLINSKDDYQKSFNKTNATRKSLVFTSSDQNGLNVKSKEIKDSINNASEIEDVLTIEGISHGFVKIVAESDTGIYSTDNTRPYKDTKRREEDFVEAAKRTILTLISKSVNNTNNK